MVKPLPQPEHKNARGIPQAPFLESVDEYASDADEAAQLMAQLQDMMRKYQFMEVATRQRKTAFDDQIPNLKQTVESIKFLKSQENSFDTQFNLNETVYAQARIDPVKTVWLWLGAGVMLEYPVDEAIEMTLEKLTAAQRGSEACAEDLEFLRENITTMEVNTARVINWQVAKRAAGLKVN